MKIVMKSINNIIINQCVLLIMTMCEICVINDINVY